MAFELRHWLAIVGVGGALVALRLLPPDALPERPPTTLSAAELRYRRLSEDLNRSLQAVQRHRWSDSLTALVVRGESTAPVVGVADRWLTPGAGTGKLLGLVVAEERRLPRRDPDVRFGFFIQPKEQSALPGTPPLGRERRETYAGVVDGRPYCLQVQVVTGSRSATSGYLAPTLERGTPTPLTLNPVGACRMYVEHGLPGPQIAAWLAHGGIDFGVGPAARLVNEQARTPRFLLGRRTVFGLNLQGRQPLTVDRCLAGIAEACARIVLDPQVTNPYIAADAPSEADGSPVVSTGAWGWGDSLVPQELNLLGELEEQFGSDAFHRFWTSDADVADAFEGAFGIPTGEWVVEWLDRTVGVDPRGPTLPASATLGTLLAVSLLAGLAVRRVQKWRSA